MILQSYVDGKWVTGAGAAQALIDPVLGHELAHASSVGIDLDAALKYSRQVGGSALRALGYADRAALLGKIAETLSANRDAYYQIALENSGSPKSDAAIDIDGAIFTLKYYARTAAALGTAQYLVDGDLVRLGRDDSFQSLHVCVPMRGVAVMINAFNFPSWGLWEKAAPALLSGMPIFAKPATATSLLTQRMVQDVVSAGILPDGALSLLCGGVRDLLDHVGPWDVVSFTGSADTAAQIRSHAALVRCSTRVNIEADSLNCALLGPDATPGSPEFDLFVKEVVREMTQKAGQKCTAIRRILVPRTSLSAAAEAISARLARTVVGNPRNASVQMGPVVSREQQQSVNDGIKALTRAARVIFDGGPEFKLVDADPAHSSFIAPTLLACDDPFAARAVHEIEVFGPVATLIPYVGSAQAFEISHLGQGSLVASVFSADTGFAERAAIELAISHGRVHCVSAIVGETQTGHGNVMPMSLHGGPGRAGGGAELGGMRALRFYHQISAIQGPRERLETLAAAAGRWPQ